jgi:hypothetical protein
VDLILVGQIHLPFVLPLHQLNSGLPNPIWAVNAGTAVSSRVRHDAGNSINVVRTSADTSQRAFTIEHWNYSAPQSAFVRAARVHCEV